MFPPLISSLSEAARLLIAGGVILYPTETYYALGCLADNPVAVKAIYQIKGRDASKKLPLLASSLKQADLAVDIKYAPRDLLTKFWPGPLTILLPARNILPQEVIGEKNLTAIRVSSGALASELASLCPFPLVSSSANLSGRKPVIAMKHLDPLLLEACAKFPSGIIGCGTDETENECKPSTIVDINPKNGYLHIIREGAIDRTQLEREHFYCCP